MHISCLRLTGATYQFSLVGAWRDLRMLGVSTTVITIRYFPEKHVEKRQFRSVVMGYPGASDCFSSRFVHIESKEQSSEVRKRGTNLGYMFHDTSQRLWPRVFAPPLSISSCAFSSAEMMVGVRRANCSRGNRTVRVSDFAAVALVLPVAVYRLLCAAALRRSLVSY